jgi:deazaflavin-dependent oxidoreductase (nitroreductase family)
MHRFTVLVGPIGRPLAGNRWFPLWAILRHTGRKSGAHYVIPIVALPSADGFVIPLPFGQRTQWLQNLLAAGGAGIRSKGREDMVDRPQLVTLDDPVVQRAVPWLLRAASRRLGILTWVSVRRIA